ncbi:hypothetical protein [Pantoea agglomerans]|uniref:hypothetical protein n=1 Tax=Enterobacter agglomerans TaxID=549 RepID=UPI003015F03E
MWEKNRKTDPDRILSGSIYSRGFTGETGENTFYHARQRRLKVWPLLPHEMMQISRSDVIGHNLTTSDAAHYFDYESAVALRNLAAA